MKKNKIGWTMRAVVLAVGAMTAAVSFQASAQAAAPFKLGVILPLTGSTAWGGRSGKVAAEMAAAEVNAKGLAGPNKIELVFGDGACDPRASYAAAQKLVNDNHVQALIGEWCSSATIAIAQVAQDAKVPMIVQDSTADGIAKNGGSYIFQASMENRDIDAKEAELLTRTFKFKTAAVIVENNDFGLSFQKNMTAALEKAGVKILVSLAQDREVTNWYSTLTRVAAAKPDLVVGSISAGQAANFVKQYAESNITIPLFFDYPPPPYIFEKQVGAQAGKIGLVRGTFFLEHPKETPAQKAFIAKFEPLLEKTIGQHQSTTHWDLATYDAVMLIADALKRGGPKPADLVKALAGTNYEGVLWGYKFNADRQSVPEGRSLLFIKDMPDGHLQVME